MTKTLALSFTSMWEYSLEASEELALKINLGAL